MYVNDDCTMLSDEKRNVEILYTCMWQSCSKVVSFSPDLYFPPQSYKMIGEECGGQSVKGSIYMNV